MDDVNTNPATPAAPPAVKPAVVSATPAEPTAMKPPGTLKKAYKPRPWEHHKEDADGRPIPPGPTMVYFEAGNPNSAEVCETEEEYVDALNRGAKDTFDPKAWE